MFHLCGCGVVECNLLREALAFILVVAFLRAADVADLADFATKDELASEAAAREAADSALADADDAHDDAIEELADGIETAEAHITNHALETTRHLTADNVRTIVAATLSTNNYNLETMDGLTDAVIAVIEKLGGTVSE